MDTKRIVFGLLGCVHCRGPRIATSKSEIRLITTPDLKEVEAISRGSRSAPTELRVQFKCIHTPPVHPPNADGRMVKTAGIDLRTPGALRDPGLMAEIPFGIKLEAA